MQRASIRTGKHNFLEEEAGCGGQAAAAAHGREFRKELGMRTSVPTLSVFAMDQDDRERERAPREWGVEPHHYGTEPKGDNGVLEQSAVLPARDPSVQQYHGSLSWTMM